ncbi:MAG: allophanate hydrolase [Neomegalonema sp.]|nr:allophanate hydrolase [Neomegalonema sp.]
MKGPLAVAGGLKSLKLEDLSTAYAGGLSPESVISHVYAQIDQINDPGIFIHLRDINEVRAEARKLGPHPDPSRPLWGVPFAVQDNLDLDAARTTASCPDYAYTARRDAFVVQRLRQCGAIPIGKTNLDQFAVGLSGLRTPHPPPRNAVSAHAAPGGAASGAAVIVSHGAVCFSIAAGAGGAARIPAAMNGVVALTPSRSATSLRGVVLARSMTDTTPIIAHAIDDAYTVLRAIAVEDPEGPVRPPVAPPAAGPAPSNVTLAAPDRACRRFYGDNRQAASFEAALGLAESIGYKIKVVDMAPIFEIGLRLASGVWGAERFRALEMFLRQSPASFLTATRRQISAAERFSAADLFGGLRQLEDINRAVTQILSQADALLLPSTPRYVELSEAEQDPIALDYELSYFSNFADLLGLPGVATPSQPRPDGRPGSTTLIGAPGAEARLVSIARRLARAFSAPIGATSLPPCIARDPVAKLEDAEIAIALSGEHMSGMALHHEVATLGGRFLRNALTAPSYRLYAIRADAHERSALHWVGDENGAAFPIELWALPRTALGDFIATLPAECSVGSARLADGDVVRSVFCAATAHRLARDVTAFGDWRGYIARRANDLA